MACPLPSIKYGSLQKRIDASGKRVPLSGSIEVTARCNQFCSHCYINKSIDDFREQQKELSERALKGIIDDITDAGCLFLLFTGGEPFVRPDFMDIYRYAISKGLLITLFSNGTTIDRAIARELSRWRPYSMEITLYGMEESYERVTGVAGSFEKCIQGIELLLEYGIPLTLKTMVTRTNRHELDAMKAFAEKRGLPFRFDPELNMGVDGRKSPASLRLSPEEALELDLSDKKRVNEWEAFCHEFIGPSSPSEYLYQCGAGIDSFHIDAYGRLSPCLMVRNATYDLGKGSFKEGFDRFIPEEISRKRSRDVKCMDCELLSLCSQCPGVAYLEGGDEESPVEYMCELAQLRAETFGGKKGKIKVSELR